MCSCKTNNYSKGSRTSLKKISCDKESSTIFCKEEYTQPTGSIKERPVNNILDQALKNDLIKTNHVVEASSGSTAISAALYCAKNHIRFTAVVLDSLSPQKASMLQILGAEIIQIPQKLGMMGAIEKSEELAIQNGWFPLRQFSNDENANGHQSTAYEIIEDVRAHNISKIDYFVSAVGTGGTLFGTTKFLKMQGFETTAVAARCFDGTVEGTTPQDFKNLIQGVQGIETEYVSYFDVLKTTKWLWKQGYPVGFSSGLNFVVAAQLSKKVDRNSVIVTVFADGVERYLSSIPQWLLNEQGSSLNPAYAA